MSDLIAFGKGFEDSQATFLARVLSGTGDPITDTEIDSIVLTVTDLADTTTTITESLDPAIVIVALTTDPRWTKDDVGYNFIHTVGAAAFPEGDRRYRVEYALDPTVGDAIHAVFEYYVGEVYGS